MDDSELELKLRQKYLFNIAKEFNSTHLIIYVELIKTKEHLDKCWAMVQEFSTRWEGALGYCCFCGTPKATRNVDHTIHLFDHVSHFDNCKASLLDKWT